MTTDDHSAEPADSIEEVVADPDPDKASSDTVDLMLANLVATGQLSADFEIGVTLTVRGAIVTGTLVGRNRWLKHLRDSLGENLQSVGDMWIEDFGYDAEAEPERLNRDQFIHLIDARVMSGGSALPSFDGPGSHWRGLLASVDGWSLGNFQPTKTSG